eukprot:1621988-Prymnesium_polylepis.1
MVLYRNTKTRGHAQGTHHPGSIYGTDTIVHRAPSTVHWPLTSHSLTHSHHLPCVLVQLLHMCPTSHLASLLYVYLTSCRSMRVNILQRESSLDP